MTSEREDEVVSASSAGAVSLEEPEKRWVVGQSIGDPERGPHYKLLKRLGEGGFGLTFVALRKGPPGSSFEKEVCLKIMHPKHTSELSSDSRRAEVNVRMFDEAKLQALVRHDNIVDVYDFHIVEGAWVIEMQFVHGVTLATYMNSFPRHQVPLHAAVYIITRILRGAAWMHAAEDGHGQPLNLVHRDLKPANIFLDLAGAVKIGDFGLAKGQGRQYVTRDQLVRGTARFMPPEQVRPHSPMDDKADVYAIGVILYHMLSGGKHPARHHEVQNEHQAYMATLDTDRVPLRQYAPHIPDEACLVVDSMVAHDPAARPTAGEARRRLLRAVRVDLLQQEDDLQERISMVMQGRPVPKMNFGAAQEPTDFVSGEADGTVREQNPLEPEKPESGVQARSSTPQPAPAVVQGTPETARDQSAPTSRSTKWRPSRVVGAAIIVLAMTGAAALGLRERAPSAEQVEARGPTGKQHEPQRSLLTSLPGSSAPVDAPDISQHGSSEEPPPIPVGSAEADPKEAPPLTASTEAIPPAHERVASTTTSSELTSAAAQKATLTIVALPRGNVWIAGKLEGKSPLTKRLAPGEYTVAVGASEPTKSETVILRARQKKTVHIEYRRLFE